MTDMRLVSIGHDFSDVNCGWNEPAQMGTVWLSKEDVDKNDKVGCSYDDSFYFATHTKVIAQPNVATYPHPMNILVQQGVGIPTVPPVERGTYVTISNHDSTASTRPQFFSSPLWNEPLQINNVEIDGFISVALWKDGTRPRKLGQATVDLKTLASKSFTEEWVEISLKSIYKVTEEVIREFEGKPLMSCKVKLALSLDQTIISQMKRGLIPEVKSV